MAYNIQPCQPADIPSLVSIFYTAFAQHPVIGDLPADIPLSTKQERDIQFHRKAFEEQHLNGARYFKAVEGGANG